MTAPVQVSQHPLVQHKVTLLRNRDSDPRLFRELVTELSQLLFYEASSDLRLIEHAVQTPLAPCTGQRVVDRIGLVPILRAGLGMAEAILRLVPFAQVWHLGLFRDEQTHRPVTYYSRLPESAHLDLAVVVDPMLATGGSAVEAVAILKNGGVRRIKYVGLIGAPEGVRALHAVHADVPIHLAALDSHLNESAYIIPGLGDAGDRQFNTA
jgi:uracil phosphoribosyltransferase